MANCTNCGAPLEPGATFCVVCGTKVAASPMPMGGGMAPAASSTCPSCGAPLEPGAAFCVVCGTSLGAAPAASPMSSPSASSVCPSCGAPLEPDAAFCVVCGTSIGPNSTAPVSSAPVPPAAPAAPIQTPPAPTGPITPVSPSAGGVPNVCPNCGAPLEQDADFCITCGKRVPGTTPQGTELAPEEQDMRTQLVFLTRDEAQKGCTKLIDIDGQQVPVTIPAGTNGGTDLDIPGYGYPNSRTGKRGTLRLNFFVS